MPTVQLIVRDGTAWRSVAAYGLNRTVADDRVPESMRSVVATYHQLVAVRPPASGPVTPPSERPHGWPEAWPSYRGQIVIDGAARCAYRRR